MRHEFQWDLPTPNGPARLDLRISSISGWLGPKELTLDGRTLYKRGIFAGINHRIDIPGAPARGHYALKAARSGPDGEWRPTLYAGNEIVPEKLGTQPPHNPRRPKTLAATVGVTYLLIFILFIMWFPIENMLDAANSQTDSRVFILDVKDDRPLPDFRQSDDHLPMAALNQPYRVQFDAVGGEPPLIWRRKSGRIPPGLTLDADTGTLNGTPIEAGDYPLTIRAIDANNAECRRAYVIRVASDVEPAPRITTERLPEAKVGKKYTANLTAIGGEPPYQWICNSRKLPNGLALKKPESSDQDHVWRIIGTPTPQTPRDPDEIPESIAGPYPIRLRVNDDAYHARSDTKPWFLPIGVTIACLLGFWSMLRASVFAFAALIVLEAIVNYMGWIPVSLAAMGLQTLILFVGVANIRHMR